MVGVNVQQKSAHSKTFEPTSSLNLLPLLALRAHTAGASAALANVCKLSLGVFSYRGPALSTSAEGDFSVSPPSISFPAIVERTAPLRQAGPVLVPVRPWLLCGTG